MKTALVYLEHSSGELPKSSLASVAAVKEAAAVFGCERVYAVLLGSSGTKTAAEAASRFGLDEVLYVEGEYLSVYLTDQYVNVIKQVCDGLQPELFVCAATTTGKDFAPHIALYLKAGQASDVMEIYKDGRLLRPMFAGNVFAEVEIETENKVLTIRSTSFDSASQSDAASAVRAFPAKEGLSSGQEYVGAVSSGSQDRPQLTEADIVVSAGRAIKSSNNFEKVIAPLADVLGAAVGATRAAVDAGYAPNDWQVGQTGKIVAPELYVAVGLSGAIQHLAGMKGSRTVVAINNDPDAPIFEISDYGLVADLYEAVPELTEALRRKAQ